MKNLFSLALISIFSITSFAQISFENGYIIDNSGIKTNCLIKNIDWRNNPVSIDYKLNVKAEVISSEIENIQEFGINGVSKYVRETVKIDRSSEEASKLSDERNPIFKEEQLYLKVLNEGKANLYQYVDGLLTRYFYSKENSPIEQLVFKSFITQNGNKIKNQMYKQQLWNELKCPTIKNSDTEKLYYKQKDLVDFFIAYNKCNNSEISSLGKKEKGKNFRLNIRPGVNFSSISFTNALNSNSNTDLGSKTGFRFGAEAEFVLPYNKNKWSLIVEPTYQFIKAENEKVIFDYKSIEIPVGIRYAFFLNDNSKIFINYSLALDFSKNQTLDIKNTTNDLDITKKHKGVMGIGYNQNNKYSLEVRYMPNKDLLGEYASWQSNYSSITLIFGYNLF